MKRQARFQGGNLAHGAHETDETASRLSLVTVLTQTHSIDSSLLSGLLGEDTFWPTEPQNIEETGLSESFVDALILKIFLTSGTLSGRAITGRIGIPFGIIEPMLESQRTRQLITHVRPAAFNDYYYSLTDSGQKQAQTHMTYCSYTGPAPVPLSDYVLSVEAQAAGLDPIGMDDLRNALSTISHNTELLDQLGPAINSNSGLFLFGPPGNGKTTVAQCLTRCLGQEIWIPNAIFDDGNLIKLADEAFHRVAPIPETGDGIMKVQQWDRRWLRIQRPTVVVGGELVMANLEVRHDARSNTCEAPLQLKSNCGCLLIDDFGRQRIAPEELLNRWIIPLENRIDYLTLPSGKKIQTPFEQLIMFSTNLNPDELVDEAFLRRVPYKIFVDDPDEREFGRIFAHNVEKLGFTPAKGACEHLLKYYERTGRPLRRCHPRDILTQVKNYCKYRKIAPQLRPDYLDQACKCYFSEL